MTKRLCNPITMATAMDKFRPRYNCNCLYAEDLGLKIRGIGLIKVEGVFFRLPRLEVKDLG